MRRRLYNKRLIAALSTHYAKSSPGWRGVRHISARCVMAYPWHSNGPDDPKAAYAKGVGVRYARTVDALRAWMAQDKRPELRRIFGR